MKIMVCGSIGFGGVEKLREFYELLEKKGFQIINHIEDKQMDYSDIKDFRDKPELCKKIVEHDLSYLDKADVIVVLVETPSFGTAIETYVARERGKKIVIFSPSELPTPWPLYFSDHHVQSKEELISVLSKLKASENN